MPYVIAPRILLVDDSPSDIGLMRAHIQKAKPEWSLVEAETGMDALTNMQDLVPDLVVTDLRMPQMDGIELVRNIAKLYPEVPVIIATARGSEGMAVTALEAGAASYVPKSQLDVRLVETIEQVLDRLETGRNYQKLIGKLARTTYSFCLDNDPALLPPLVDLLQQMAFGMEIVDATERRRLGIALDEALFNAMYHGNLELPQEELAGVRRQLREGKKSYLIEQRRNDPEYGDRKVLINAELHQEYAKFIIRDDGIGFFPGNIPTAHDPKTLESEGGRGLVLMANFMKEVKFNEIGNEVTMITTRRHSTRSL